MTISLKFFSRLAVLGTAVLLCGNLVLAEDKEKAAEPQKIELAEGKLELTVTGDWKKVAPKSRIIDYEFAVAPIEGDEMPGRVTVMGAGGSIEANIDRWVAQFSQPDGSDTKAKVEEKTVAGQKITTVDIAGTYDDRPPFAGNGVMREDYRMLSLIIQTEKLGNYFVKFYGPAATVTKNKEAFEAMAKSLQSK